MIKREQKFTTEFQRWLRNRWVDSNAYFEVKVTEGDSLRFSEVKEHQLTNLQIKRIIYKFSDAMRWGTPFDIILCEGQGYIVINFNYPSKIFFIIPVENFVEEKKHSTRKSLTKDRAKEIGTEHELGI